MHRCGDPSTALTFGLGIAAGLTQGLDVLVVIGAAFGQRLDVVTYDGEGHEALPGATPTQRLTREQLSTLLLQSPASHPFVGCLLHPCFFRMLRTTAGAIGHGYTARPARLRRRTRHDEPNKKPAQYDLGGLVACGSLV